MAYPFICTPCMTGEHDDCEKSERTPPEGLIGGGVCVCQHLEDWSNFEKEIIKRQLGNVGEEE